MSKTHVGAADSSAEANENAEGRRELTRAAHVLGKKWHPVIVHRLLEHGPLGFNRVEDSIGDISSTVLSDSLDRSEHGLVDRAVISETPYASSTR